jgi:hypothetical protein
MSDVQPKIVWPAGNSGTVLNFVQPPQMVPAYVLRAQRHDNLSSAGVRESILESITSYTDMHMDWVVLGSDVAAWNSFFTGCALLGLYFDLYPDGASTTGTADTFTTYRLVENSWKAAYRSLGLYQFKAQFRAAVPLITTYTLPNGVHSTSYSQTVTATGGTRPLAFSITSGSLPNPLTINSSTGVISGTPTSAGTSNFTVTVTDGAQYVPQTHSVALTIVVT